MKKSFLCALIGLGLITAPALAGRVDVSSESGFGSLEVSKFSLSTGSSTLSVDARVFLKGGTYTYVYEISGQVGIPIAGVINGSFDSNLNWGAVGSPVLLANATFGNSLIFYFSPSVASGATTIVYAQSTLGPLEALFGGTGYGTFDSLGPGGPPAPLANAPEPGSLLLLATGLLGGAGFLRKKFIRSS